MANRPEPEIAIDAGLVRRLLAAQHPDLAGLPLRLHERGWDNTNVRLGERHLVRLPHREVAAPLILNEQRWLPVIAGMVGVAIPAPTHIGVPDALFPWNWSVVPWFEGEVAASASIADPAATARALGRFLARLHRPAPPAAPVNPVRGCPLEARREAFRANLNRLGDRSERAAVAAVFDAALTEPPGTEQVWLHGDLHTRNIVVDHGVMRAVIDWGDLCRGSRAVDLASAWMLVPDHIAVVAEHAGASESDWRVARGWAAHFAVIYTVASDDDPVMAAIGERLLRAVTA